MSVLVIVHGKQVNCKLHSHNYVGKDTVVWVSVCTLLLCHYAECMDLGFARKLVVGNNCEFYNFLYSRVITAQLCSKELNLTTNTNTKYQIPNTVDTVSNRGSFPTYCFNM